MCWNLQRMVVMCDVGQRENARRAIKNKCRSPARPPQPGPRPQPAADCSQAAAENVIVMPYRVDAESRTGHASRGLSPRARLSTDSRDLASRPSYRRHLPFRERLLHDMKNHWGASLAFTRCLMCLLSFPRSKMYGTLAQ